MKAVLLAPLPPPSGGIASWAKRMETAELKNDWNVVIVNEKVIGGRDIFGSNTKKSILIEIKRCIKIWSDLWHALNDGDVRVVHSNIPAGFNGMLREMVCAIISKLKRRKFIIHYRCTIPNMVKDKKNRIIFKMLTDLSDACIVLNSPSKKFTEESSKTPVYLIPNFVNINETKLEGTTQNTQEKKGKCRVLYVGGVIKEKGCLEIIEAAKEIRDIEFRLVGSIGPDIEKTEISDNVIFCGELDKQGVQTELAQADMFVFMSHFYGEGFSNALAEAMAAGLPCIVSNWAANEDMIENKGGFVVPLHDIQELCKKIRVLADSNEMRHEMGKWNVEKVKQTYLQDQVTSKYVDLYEDIMNR